MTLSIHRLVSNPERRSPLNMLLFSVKVLVNSVLFLQSLLILKPRNRFLTPKVWWRVGPR